MFGISLLTAPARPERPPAGALSTARGAAARRIALLRSGRRHGPLTRLITPWDLGELTQPFVFLGYSEFAPGWQPLLAGHPQPDIATLTLVLGGQLGYEDASGHESTLTAGGIRWTTPGEWVRHDGGHAASELLRVFQLWVALPPAPRRSAVDSHYFAAQEIQQEGPVRVMLGQFGEACGALPQAAPDINYFHVRLRDGELWRYVAPYRHNVTWLAVDRGGVRLPQGEHVYEEQIALCGDSGGVLELQADGETSFVLGSATRLGHAAMQGHREFVDAGLAALTSDEVERQVVHRAYAHGRR